MKLSLFVSAYAACVAIAAPLKKRDPDLETSRCPSFCNGTNATADRALYICGDPRLGPVQLPAGIPLDGIAGIDSTYHRFGGLCPGAFLATYTDAATGQFVYPRYDGFTISTDGQPSISNITLAPGTFLDRFGSEFGNFMSPAGAPYAQRSLPPTNLNAAPGSLFPYNYRVYVVSRSLTVRAGPIAGWFGQQGLGVQFLMPDKIVGLVDQGYLNRVNLTADPYWRK